MRPPDTSTKYPQWRMLPPDVYQVLWFVKSLVRQLPGLPDLHEFTEGGQYSLLNTVQDITYRGILSGGQKSPANNAQEDIYMEDMQHYAGHWAWSG